MVCETIRGTEQIDLPPRSTFIYRIFNSGDMARRSKKLPPTTRRLSFSFIGGATTGVIDIGQCLSLLNRKAFRQGMEYYVESWNIEADVSTRVHLAHLPQSWVNTNAWTAAFKTWIKSQEQVENYDEIKGRYHDFKIFFDSVHATAGTVANVLPNGFNAADVAAISATASASWDASEIQIPNVGASGNTVGYQMHMIGPDANSKGIIEGYANSRARPQLTDPNTLTGTVSWMETAFDSGENLGEIVTDLTHENDSPPYFIDEDTAFEFYPGGSNASNGAGLGIEFTSALALNPIVGSWATRRAPGFIAPCGLISVLGTVTGFTVTLHLAAGPSKGVMARPMQDVN